LTLLAWWHHVY